MQGSGTVSGIIYRDPVFWNCAVTGRCQALLHSIRTKPRLPRRKCGTGGRRETEKAEPKEPYVYCAGVYNQSIFPSPASRSWSLQPDFFDNIKQYIRTFVSYYSDSKFLSFWFKDALGRRRILFFLTLGAGEKGNKHRAMPGKMQKSSYVSSSGNLTWQMRAQAPREKDATDLW